MSARVMILMHYDTVAPVKRNINDIRVGNDRAYAPEGKQQQQPPSHCAQRMKRTNERWTGARKKSLRKTRKVTWPLPA